MCAVDIWLELVSGSTDAFVGIGVAVAIIIAVGIWKNHDEEGDSCSVPRCSSTLSQLPIRAWCRRSSRSTHAASSSATTATLDPGGRPPRDLALRRRRLYLRGLDARLREALRSATADTQLQTVATRCSRYQHRLGDDIDLAALAEQLRDPVWLARCGIRSDRAYRDQRFMVRLVPVADAASEEMRRWEGAMPPSRFGHALDEPIPGSRCGIAAELAGHYWLTRMVMGPGRACVLDPDGTLYSVVGRPFLPYESGCPDLLGGERL